MEVYGIKPNHHDDTYAEIQITFYVREEDLDLDEIRDYLTEEGIYQIPNDSGKAYDDRVTVAGQKKTIEAGQVGDWQHVISETSLKWKKDTHGHKNRKKSTVVANKKEQAELKKYVDDEFYE